MKVELFVRQNNAKDLPRIRLVRERDRSGDETFWIQDQVVDKDAYVQEMEALCLKDSLKTIIRQEEINDAIQMNPRLRFEFIQKIFGMQEEDEVIEHLRRTTDPLFRNYFSLLMPLAEAKLELIRVNQAVGLEISVTLPGNRVRRSHQLSGGEKSVTSLALKLAVFKQLESPFYLLDEVEPSLDYINHKSMQALLKDVASQKQLIMITHLRSTIKLANTLHGVRTRWDGSSFMKFYFVMNERLLRLYKCC